MTNRAASSVAISGGDSLAMHRWSAQVTQNAHSNRFWVRNVQRSLLFQVMTVSTPDDVTETARSMGGQPLESNGTVKIANFASRALTTASGKEGAQQWIAAWRKKNAPDTKSAENGTMKVSTTDNVFTDEGGSWPPPPPAATAGGTAIKARDVPENVADARKWIATWREKAKQTVMQ